MTAERLPGAFRRLLAARLLSTFGDLVLPVAISFAVLTTLHRGAAAVGVVMGAEFVGMLMFFLLGGVFADRLAPVITMVAADLGRAALQLAAAVMLAEGTMTVPVLAVMMMLRGVGSAFFSPAVTPLMLDTVGPERVQRAGGLLYSTTSIAVVVSPLAAGGLVVLLGPAGVLAVDGVSFLASAALLIGLRGPARPAVGQGSASVLDDVRGGLREVLSRPWLWSSIGVAAVVDVLASSPYTTLLPVVAQQGYHGALGYSWLLAALGAGAVGGGLVAGRLPVRRHGMAANLMLIPMALSAVALATHAPLWLVLVTMVLCGASQSAYGALWGTLLSRGVPRAALARVNSWDSLGSFALRPFGQSVGGVVAGRVGTGPVLLVAAAVLVIAPLCLIATPPGRRVTAEVERESAAPAAAGPHVAD